MTPAPPALPPAKVSTAVPATAPTEVPPKPPAKARTKAPATVPAKAPAKAPAQLRTKAPAKARTEAPAKVPAAIPAKAPVKAPAEVAAKAPAKARAQAPATVPAEVAAKAPATVQTTPAAPRLARAAEAAPKRPAAAPRAPRRPAGAAAVRRVAARMRALAAELPERDGVAVFNRVYLSVTEEVARRVAAGQFADGPRAARLTVLFAERYLAAVTGPPAAPACWRTLIRARNRRRVAPLQFALAGITAHVGHDLPLAVVDACRATRCPPPVLDADFAEVGEVLAAIEERVREELMPGPDLLERFDPLTHAVGCWSLARARSGAWGAARVLWALRGHPEGYARCVAGLDRTTALAVRALLTPAGPAAPAPSPAPAAAAGTAPQTPAQAPAATTDAPATTAGSTATVTPGAGVQSSGSSTGAISS